MTRRDTQRQNRQERRHRHLFGTKIRTTVTLCVAFLVLGVGAAFGDWIAEGSGSTIITETTGQNGSAAVEVVATSSAMTDGISPGSAPVPIDFRVSNLNGFPVQVSSVILAVTGTQAGDSCPPSDFSIVQPTEFVMDNGTDPPLPITFTAENTLGSSLYDYGSNATPATIQMNADAPVTCENTTVSISITAS